MVVYKIENKENLKKYIGIDSCGNRKNKHFWDLQNNKHVNNYLQNSYNKYGKDSFEFEIIEECESIEELNEREKFWIDELETMYNQNGYNIESGGLRHSCSEETKEKIRKSISKPVNQYDLEGNYIQTFDSIKEASNKVKTSINNVVTCLKGITKTAANHQWKYFEGNKENINPVKSANYRRGSGWRKKVKQMDLQGNLIRIYNSIKEAAEAVNRSSESVSQCLSGRSKTSAGFKWDYCK